MLNWTEQCQAMCSGQDRQCLRHKTANAVASPSGVLCTWHHNEKNRTRERLERDLTDLRSRLPDTWKHLVFWTATSSQNSVDTTESLENVKNTNVIVSHAEAILQDMFQFMTKFMSHRGGSPLLNRDYESMETQVVGLLQILKRLHWGDISETSLSNPTLIKIRDWSDQIKDALVTPMPHHVQRNDVMQDREFMAIGDLHGDAEVMMHLLCCVAQVVPKNTTLDSKEIEWLGGDLVIVSCGDIIDPFRRGMGNREWNASLSALAPHQDEAKMMAFWQRLDEAATLKGGRAIRIVGNHELCQMRGWVSEDDRERARQVAGMADQKKKQGSRFTQRVADFSFADKTVGRLAGYMRNHSMGRNGESRFLSCVKIGHHIMTHGGITVPLWKTLQAAEPNRMRGADDAVVFLNDQFQIFLASRETSDLHESLFGFHENGITTTRKLSQAKESQCNFLPFPDVTQVMGHSVQPTITDPLPGSAPPRANDGQSMSLLDATSSPDYFILHGPPAPKQSPRAYSCMGINSTCGGRVQRIDVGMSRAFDNPEWTTLEENKCIGARAPQLLHHHPVLGDSVRVSRSLMPRPGIDQTRLNETIETFVRQVTVSEKVFVSPAQP